MARKITFHSDALMAVAIVFVLSFGFNLFQRYQYQDLLQKYVDTEWARQNLAVDLKEVKSHAENCHAPVSDTSLQTTP